VRQGWLTTILHSYPERVIQSQQRVASLRGAPWTQLHFLFNLRNHQTNIEAESGVNTILLVGMVYSQSIPQLPFPFHFSGTLREQEMVLINRFILFCSIHLIATASPLLANESDIPNTFRIVGYLPDYRALDFDPKAVRGLTDLIVFSGQLTDTGEIDLSRLKKVSWAKLKEFKTHHRVRLILCVGGWERSKQFAIVSESPDKRSTFVKSAIKLCLDERLDGLDLDWEHPKNKAEEEGYGKLLADLKEGFRPHGLVLSVTIAAWQKLPKEAYTVVDWVNVMAYDHKDRHSTLEGAQSDIKRLLDAGIPAEKLTLGLPFYGRHRTDREKTLTYREIVAKHHPKADVDEIEHIYFNGPNTIRKKVEFARTSKLAGVMIWELGQDATGEQSLLKMIEAVVNRKEK
jgi:chitinase